MNVLYLTMNPNRQSTTVPTEGWFRFLPDRGLRPVLVSREVGDFHRWANAQGIPTYQDSLPTPSKRNLFPALRSLMRLAAIVRRHKVELVHCNEQNVYPIGQYLARLCNLPCVVSVHFTMGRRYCQWAFGGRRTPRRLFFLSPGSRDACREGVQGVVPEDRWRLLYNGLDLEEFRPDQLARERFRKSRVDGNAIVIGVACATRPRKQLEHLFEAAARVDDQRLRVLVAGGPVEGDADYTNRLFDLGRSKLGDRLILLGHLEELCGFYNGLDAFVNTSQEEACSISVIESLAYGCPVLGYPSKSVHNQVLPDGGEIVPQDDVEALAAAITRWVGDRDQLAERRVAARRQARSLFDIRELSGQLWREYEDVLAGNDARGRSAGEPLRSPTKVSQAPAS